MLEALSQGSTTRMWYGGERWDMTGCPYVVLSVAWREPYSRLGLGLCFLGCATGAELCWAFPSPHPAFAGESSPQSHHSWTIPFELNKPSLLKSWWPQAFN